MIANAKNCFDHENYLHYEGISKGIKRTFVWLSELLKKLVVRPCLEHASPSHTSSPTIAAPSNYLKVNRALQQFNEYVNQLKRLSSTSSTPPDPLQKFLLTRTDAAKFSAQVKSVRLFAAGNFYQPALMRRKYVKLCNLEVHVAGIRALVEYYVRLTRELFLKSSGECSLSCTLFAFYCSCLLERFKLSNE